MVEIEKKEVKKATRLRDRPIKISHDRQHLLYTLQLIVYPF